MGLSEDGVWELARNVEVAYRPRRMQLVGKKHRPIDPMYPRPKKLFKGFHRFIQKGGLYHRHAHGGVVRRSCFTSAEEHLGARFVWTIDVQDCYPSISGERFREEMRLVGFPPDTAELLGLLCTVRGGIPQGSPLSNDALNLYLWRIDQVIASTCGQRRLSYTRVADDLVISGGDRDAGFEVMGRVESLLRDRGLRVNEKKRKKSGFQARERGPLVHNIGVGNSRGTTICTKHRLQAIELAEKYRAACKSVQVGSLEALGHKRQALVGWFHYCRQARTGPDRHLKKMLEIGDRVVLKKLRALKITAEANKWWFISENRNEPRRLVSIWKSRLAADHHDARAHELATRG